MSTPSRVVDEALAGDLALAAMGTARAFAAGATLWAVAPGWEPHAHHIAVEFVHPVVVGTRALPAVAVVGSGLVAQARVCVRPGDLMVLVASADDPAARDLIRRAPAWGVTTIWIGAGARPAAGSADHVATGAFVQLYHLLWELTHVCFEHPGLLGAEACAGEVCVTCSDEGRPGEVVSVTSQSSARVRTATGVVDCDTTLVAPVRPGDLVLVHAGLAIAVDGR
jgi:hypothetical protein